jgi:hypothetical protein
MMKGKCEENAGKMRDADTSRTQQQKTPKNP